MSVDKKNEVHNNEIWRERIKREDTFGESNVKQTFSMSLVRPKTTATRRESTPRPSI